MERQGNQCLLVLGPRPGAYLFWEGVWRKPGIAIKMGEIRIEMRGRARVGIYRDGIGGALVWELGREDEGESAREPELVAILSKSPLLGQDVCTLYCSIPTDVRPLSPHSAHIITHHTLAL